MKWIVPLLMFAMLAGCSEEATKAEPEAEVDAFKDIKVADDKGVIRGVVVDQTIMPIADATIQITGNGASTTSDADGAFLFVDLEPGSYFLEIKKPGYEPVQANSDVVAGVTDPAIVKVLLERKTSGIPYAETIPFSGYVQCAIGAPVAGLEWRACNAAGNSVNLFTIEFQEPLNMTQTEIYWEGTNTLGNGLKVGHVRPNGLERYADADGSSPLSLRVARATIDSNNDDDNDFLVVVTASSSEVSVVLEQSFEMFHTNFYGFDGDEGWLFGMDGPHPSPY